MPRRRALSAVPDRGTDRGDEQHEHGPPRHSRATIAGEVRSDDAEQHRERARPPVRSRPHDRSPSEAARTATASRTRWCSGPARSSRTDERRRRSTTATMPKATATARRAGASAATSNVGHERQRNHRTTRAPHQVLPERLLRAPPSAPARRRAPSRARPAAAGSGTRGSAHNERTASRSTTPA